MSQEDLEDSDYFMEILLHGHSEKTERMRVKHAIADMNPAQIINFAKEYSDLGIRRCFPGIKIEDGRDKPGDLVFEVGKPGDLLVHVGSVRPRKDDSVRLVIRLRDKTLRRAASTRNFKFSECSCENSWASNVSQQGHSSACYFLNYLRAYKEVLKMYLQRYAPPPRANWKERKEA